MQAKAGQRVTLTKISWVDWASERSLSLETWGRQSLRNLEVCAQQGYDALLAESAANWHAWWQIVAFRSPALMPAISERWTMRSIICV